MRYRKGSNHGLEFRGEYTEIAKYHERDVGSAAMIRIAQVVVPDFPHHVVQRGAGGMDVFSPLTTDKNASACGRRARKGNEVYCPRRSIGNLFVIPHAVAIPT